MSERQRVAIIGAGHVGATAAYALMLRALFAEIVLIDSNMDLARAEAADIADANALARPAHIWAGAYEDAASARIAVITAGVATHGSESRLSVMARSAVIVSACVDQLMRGGFSGVILIAANPVDIMSRVALGRSGLAPAQVIGTGTLLDTSRLQQTLGARLNLAPHGIEALVLGEHGDSEVAALSAARIGGMSLAEYAGGLGLDPAQIGKTVREAAYGIVAGKGYTSFGIATAIVRLCEAIVRDERAVLPVSTLMTGQYDLTGMYLSLPCVLGAKGVMRVITPDLSETELRELRHSAEVLDAAYAALEADPGFRPPAP